MTYDVPVLHYYLPHILRVTTYNYFLPLTNYCRGVLVVIPLPYIVGCLMFLKKKKFKTFWGT